jgi:hypothetical protein
MTDVTARMHTYRECVRHIWNTWAASGVKVSRLDRNYLEQDEAWR